MEGRLVTVLVIDDEEAVRAVIRRILEGYGMEVATAETGEEALGILTKLQTQKPVVLLDMFLLNSDSREIFKQIRRQFPDVPILITSGYTEQEAKEHFSEIQPAGFVHKPYRPEELAAKIYDAL
jgi:CheY-like chemotaxis protein